MPAFDKDGQMIFEKNERYWMYNLPLQAGLIEASVLNYSPRKDDARWMPLSQVLGDQTEEEYFNTAADVLENLATLMRARAKNPKLTVYYPDRKPPTKCSTT